MHADATGLLPAVAGMAPFANVSSVHARNIELLLAGPCQRPALVAGLHFELAKLLRRNPTESEVESLITAVRGDTADGGERQGLAALREKFRWPTSIPPVVQPNEDCHFTRPQTRAMLQRRLAERKPSLVLEIGSWLGGSTRVIADSSQAHVIAIDTWLGSEEHQTGTAWDQRHEAHREVRTHLFHTFTLNCSNYHEVITPLRATSLAGLHEVHSYGLQPGLVFIDGAHDKASVAADLLTTHELFGKDAWIVIDDYGTGEAWLRGLDEAVNEFAHERGYRVEHNGGACTFHW